MTVPVPVKLPSNNMADLAYPGHPGLSEGMRPGAGADGQHRAARPAPAALAPTRSPPSRSPRASPRSTTCCTRRRSGPATRRSTWPAPARAAAPSPSASSTLQALMYDVARSLIHHGFNKILFINGHGSNVKVVDPVLRKIRYDTGAMVGFCIPYMERYIGPPRRADGEPGGRDARLARQRARDLADAGAQPGHRPHGSRGEDADQHPEVAAEAASARRTARPTSSSRATPTSSSRWTTTSSPTAASSATRSGPPPRRAQEAFRRYAEHVAKAVQALAAVNVTIKNREFIDRV